MDYLSGDDDPADDKSKAFNTLYATNHKFYGMMDFFLVNPASGLTDMQIGVVHSPLEKTYIKATLHILNSSEDITINNSEENAYGNEIDILVNYAYGDGLNFQAGFGMFMPGEIFKNDQAKGKDNAMWGYLQTTFALK